MTDSLILSDILQELKKQTKLLEQLTAPRPSEKPSIVPTTPPKPNQSEAEQLMALLQSDMWPQAIDPTLLCDDKSQQDKKDRAEGILELSVDINLKDVSFLDFGCGEGHVAYMALGQKPKVSVGYDIKNQDWGLYQQSDKLTLTTSWDVVREKGPYKAILVYDVLDHIVGDGSSVIEALRKIRQVTTPDAKVYVRCHPWCSRHGTHLYTKLNKAYVHLVLSDDELRNVGYDPMLTRKVNHPLGTYTEWFTLAGFQVRHNQIDKESVEPFFSDHPVVAKRIRAGWRDSRDPELREGRKMPIMQMEMQFIDYILG